MPAGFDLTETVVEWIRTAFACTNLFFSVKYKPLPTGSSETSGSGLYFTEKNRFVQAKAVRIHSTTVSVRSKPAGIR